jgi:hypothetical protein
MLLATTAIPAHAAKKPKLSKLSAYAGPCPGSCLFSGNGFTYTGNTQGSFVVARRQEVGTLTLNSVITDGSTSAGLLESYQFRNRSFFYTISVAGSSSGAGSGTASITPHVISFSATFSISSLTYNIIGTIRQTKHRIFVSEVLSTSGSSANISYTLRRPKHRS